MDGSKLKLLPHGVHLKNEIFYALIILVTVGQKGILLTARSLWQDVFSIISELTNGPQIIVGSSFGVGCPSWQLAINYSILPR